MTAHGTRTARWDHGVSWLAVLAEAPPSMEAVGYALHARGFAGHMARTATVTRYYLQCPRGTDPADWSEDRIWTELEIRLRVDEFGQLKDGPVLEKAVVDLRSDVLDTPGGGSSGWRATRPDSSAPPPRRAPISPYSRPNASRRHWRWPSSTTTRTTSTVTPPTVCRGSGGPMSSRTG